MNNQIGFMQGRLCEQVNGKIQAFPWQFWENEFPAAQAIGMHLMEWTLDDENLYENPLLTPTGQEKIKSLKLKHQISIPSLTGDCFMQAPFWKANRAIRSKLQNDFLAIVHACSKLSIEMIVVPLVDNGRLDTEEQTEVLINFLLGQRSLLNRNNVRVIFESDLPPAKLSELLTHFPNDTFGINYDIGNSAALGFSPEEELAAYGERILNVHVKDRLFNGTTVPLNTGSANFDSVFAGLSKLSYKGNLILQTARAIDGQHSVAIETYRDMTAQWINKHFLANCT